jgi:hypothetical protein
MYVHVHDERSCGQFYKTTIMVWPAIAVGNEHFCVEQLSSLL